PDVERKDLQDIDRPDDIVLVRRGTPVERKRRLAAEAEGQPPGEEGAHGRHYSFNISAPRNTWIKSSDVNMEIGLSDRFRVEYDHKTFIYGDVRVLRGRASVLGRDFEVQRDSRVSFSGPAKRPFVSVTAVHQNTREQVTV